MVFSSGINAWLPFPFGLFRFSISLLSLLCFPFLISPIRLTDRFLGSSASPLGSSAFFRFLCLVSRAFSSVLQYSASCLFPFVLPGFAPTAVPPVLTFFRLSTSLRCSSLRFPVLSSGSRLGFDYLAFCFFFSLLPVFPSQWFFRCASIFINLPTLAYLFSLGPVTSLPFQLWYSAFSCNSLLRFSVSPHRCYCSLRPPVSSTVVPLSFRLRFRILGRAMYPEN